MSGLWGDGGKSAAAATTEASALDVQGRREGLDYLKEAEALPREVRETALGGLQDILGIQGDELTGIPGIDTAMPSQEETIAQAKGSPLYQAILGGREAGEESILRNASATGGLRSGNASANLAKYNQQLENEALLTSYGAVRGEEQDAYNRAFLPKQMQLQGVQSLAGVPSNVNQIVQSIQGIGSAQGQGVQGAAQAREQGRSQRSGNILGLGQLAIGAFSDIRLKDNVKKVGKKNGFNLYTWDWNELAAKLGLIGSDLGVMAHEIAETMPNAIGEKDGYVTVNYEMLGAQ